MLVGSKHDPGVAEPGAVLRRPEAPPIVDTVRAEVALRPCRRPPLLVLAPGCVERATVLARSGSKTHHARGRVADKTALDQAGRKAGQDQGQVVGRRPRGSGRSGSPSISQDLPMPGRGVDEGRRVGVDDRERAVPAENRVDLNSASASSLSM